MSLCDIQLHHALPVSLTTCLYSRKLCVCVCVHRAKTNWLIPPLSFSENYIPHKIYTQVNCSNHVQTLLTACKYSEQWLKREVAGHRYIRSAGYTTTSQYNTLQYSGSCLLSPEISVIAWAVVVCEHRCHHLYITVEHKHV